ncbi:hypothetical protein PG999_003129 [Apiospora kogelbergensis]|uniref:Uncharacterized protein n=1 Tax=Apiospora kogelbergensis TaxID=1337665 RepID=A0AAW0RA31_9PEZI
MGASSHRSANGGAESSKSSRSSAKKLMSRDKVNEFMSTKNSGGDPVTALALRPGGSSKSSADRQAKVGSEVEASLAQLNGNSS